MQPGNTDKKVLLEPSNSMSPPAEPGRAGGLPRGNRKFKGRYPLFGKRWKALQETPMLESARMAGGIGKGLSRIKETNSDEPPFYALQMHVFRSN